MNHKVKATKHSELGDSIIFCLENPFFGTKQYLIYNRVSGSCLMSNNVEQDTDGSWRISVDPDDFLSGTSDDLLMELPDIDESEIQEKK